ncbi:nicotinate-nucleotide adenylyltransferase [Beggiatoa alba]|nr:nicotinate-nucleotide adenylyltransferase [Beggiatoa alba]
MIGVFGGTFDPVHFGHIKPALDVMQRLALEQLRFIPCSIPAHRSKPIASEAQRLAMLHAVINELENCVIDERELNRQGISYMVDTLQSLHSERGKEHNRVELCLIIGMDVFLGLYQWHQWQTIFELANVVVTCRPGSELNRDALHPDLVNIVEQRQINSEKAFIGKDKGALMFMTVTQLDISATDIRRRVKHQQSIEEFVPMAVNSIIQQQQLYTG